MLLLKKKKKTHILYSSLIFSWNAHKPFIDFSSVVRKCTIFLPHEFTMHHNCDILYNIFDNKGVHKRVRNKWRPFNIFSNCSTKTYRQVVVHQVFILTTAQEKGLISIYYIKNKISDWIYLFFMEEKYVPYLSHCRNLYSWHESGRSSIALRENFVRPLRAIITTNEKICLNLIDTPLSCSQTGARNRSFNFVRSYSFIVWGY